MKMNCIDNLTNKKKMFNDESDLEWNRMYRIE